MKYIQTIFCALLFGPLIAVAQGIIPPVTTSGFEIGFADVAPRDTGAEISFTVNEYDSVTLNIITPVDGAEISILGPDQTVITSDDPRIEFFLGSEMTPSAPGGVFYVSDITNLVDGIWRVKFNFPAAGENALLMLTVTPQSIYQSAIVINKIAFVTGEEAAIGYLVRKSGMPIIGLSPTVTIRKDGATITTLLAKDDGLNSDGEKNDGLYTGSYTFTEEGTYSIVGNTTIMDNGKTIHRQAEIMVDVNQARLEILGSRISSTLDPRGCANSIDLSIDVNVLKVDHYTLSSALIGDNEKKSRSSSSADLPLGPQTVKIVFSTRNILRNIGVQPNYRIESLYGSFSDGIEGTKQAFSPQFNLGSYSEPPVCTPPIEIISDLIVEEIYDGRYISALTFSFPISVATAGRYSINYALVGPKGERLTYVFFEENLLVGRNIVTATVEGSVFAQLDGPYRVVSALVVGANRSQTNSYIGQTKPYTKRDFGPQEGDTIFKGSLITTGATIQDGEVYVWGYRGSGQQGNGARVVKNNAPPAKVNTLTHIACSKPKCYCYWWW